jgi:acyl transferase domain-containing protein
VIESAGGYQVMVGNDKDFLCSRVAYKLNLRGPAVGVQTACSTSLVAVQMAFESLLRRECDMALAGGVSIPIPQYPGYLYVPGMILSRDGHCRAFDAAASGTVPGGGAGIAVLKRLDDAIADRDHIYAVIRGAAVNNDGSAKVGYSAPSVEGQSAVIRKAMQMAGFAPESVGRSHRIRSAVQGFRVGGN